MEYFRAIASVEERGKKLAFEFISVVLFAVAKMKRELAKKKKAQEEISRLNSEVIE